MKSSKPPSRKTTGKSNRSANAEKSITLFSSDDRGQTFFDFVVGITLFLFVLLFTVFFIPGLIDPFQPEQGGSTVLSDRGADHLTQNVLRESGSGPYVLDTTCTVALFDGHAQTACDVHSNTLREIVGMGDSTDARVEIVNESGDPIVIDGVQLAYGNGIDDSHGNVYSATRMVTINGQMYELNYMVW